MFLRHVIRIDIFDLGAEWISRAVRDPYVVRYILYFRRLLKILTVFPCDLRDFLQNTPQF